MSDDSESTPSPAPVSRPAVELVRQPHGGALRRGNPGNRGNRNGRRSAIAREILEASTPQAARILKHMSLKGEIPASKKGEKAQPLSHPDHIKALVAHLDRGGAPAVSAIVAAAGSPFTVFVRAAADEEPIAPPVPRPEQDSD